MEHEVAAVPTCIFFRGGKMLERVEGAKAADVSKMVRNLVAQQFTLPIPQGMIKYSNLHYLVSSSITNTLNDSGAVSL